MNKILVTGGCSFSNPDAVSNHKKTWVNYIVEKYNFKKFVHTGQGACGNNMISERIICALQTLLDNNYPPDNLYVGVMWSGIERSDLFISPNGITNYEKLHNSADNGYILSTNSKVVSNIDEYPVEDVVESGYIRPGSIPFRESWWRQKTQREYFNLWYDNFYTVEYQFIRTLKSILLLQSFCKSHNIKYYMSVRQNIFNAQNNIGELLDKISVKTYKKTKCLPKYVDIFKVNCEFLWKSIDMDKFIFFENEDVVWGGIGEYATINNLEFWDDGAHVALSGHIKFIDKYTKDIDKLWNIK